MLLPTHIAPSVAMLLQGQTPISEVRSVTNAINKTMGVSPFVANKGFHPTLAADLNTDVPSIRVQQFMASLDELHQELKQNILHSQQCYQKHADQHHSTAPPHLKLVIMSLLKLSTSTLPACPGSWWRRTWVPMRSLGTQEHSHSPSDSQNSSAQSTQYFMCPSWNPPSLTHSHIIDNCHHHQ